VSANKKALGRRSLCVTFMRPAVLCQCERFVARHDRTAAGRADPAAGRRRGTGRDGAVPDRPQCGGEHAEVGPGGVFRAEYSPVVALARMVLGDAHACEDVAQEVFLAFARSTLLAFTEGLLEARSPHRRTVRPDPPGGHRRSTGPDRGNRLLAALTATVHRHTVTTGTRDDQPSSMPTDTTPPPPACPDTRKLAPRRSVTMPGQAARSAVGREAAATVRGRGQASVAAAALRHRCVSASRATRARPAAATAPAARPARSRRPGPSAASPGRPGRRPPLR